MATFTESPIEQDFLDAFRVAAGDDGRIHLGATIGKLKQLASYESNKHLVYIAPQVWLVPYRCDFVLTSFETVIYPRVVCVECDGHEFHKATDEQRNRDRIRDDAIKAMGVKVLRFSGKQIKRDPFGCAYEAIALATQGRIGRDVDGFVPLGAVANAFQLSDVSKRMTGERDA